ncbi:hypothetical protein Ddc_15403 [Ditylenchus destructor]|nr:hypothetical protein Ddc_15403 [Ditylenchus destructor]
MISLCRSSTLGNARTLLLNRRYSSSIAVTSRSNVFAGLHKNDFLRWNGDNSAQTFLCMQQRGLRTKEKTSDAKPSDSSSNDSEPNLGRISTFFRKIREILTNPRQFRSFKEIRNAVFAAERELAGTNRFLLMFVNISERITPEDPKKVVLLFIIVNLISGYLAYTYSSTQHKKAQRKNAPSQSGSHSIWNASSSMAIDSDFEKKELRTGNEFDLNALLPTENDSGKHQSYSEYK